MSTAHEPVTEPPVVLARGPWAIEQVSAHWREEEFEPAPEHTVAADAAIEGLQRRGSPSHDGVAARLVDYRVQGECLAIELQTLSLDLRLVAVHAASSIVQR